MDSLNSDPPASSGEEAYNRRPTLACSCGPLTVCTMTDSVPPENLAAPTGSDSAGSRPEELPPVEPPSAGYIVQLFLIPALIVAAVIGVWALFGMLANTDADWEKLVQELGSSNNDRRWRAAFVLAQILRNEEITSDQTDETALADNPKVAAALTKLLRESLALNSSEKEVVMQEEFLARTLGSLRADDTVLPALADALKPERNLEVRKSSLMSLATIAGRNFNLQAESAERLEPDREYVSGAEVITLKEPLPLPTIANDDVWNEVKRATQDEEASIRHLSAYAMGVISGPDAMKELRVVLLDRDDKTRANAAVALARNGQADGVPVLLDLVETYTEEFSEDAAKSLPEWQNADEAQQQDLLLKMRSVREFEAPIIIGNCLTALDSIWVLLTDKQREAAKAVLEKVAQGNHAADLKMQANQLLQR